MSDSSIQILKFHTFLGFQVKILRLWTMHNLLVDHLTHLTKVFTLIRFKKTPKLKTLASWHSPSNSRVIDSIIIILLRGIWHFYFVVHSTTLPTEILYKALVSGKAANSITSLIAWATTSALFPHLFSPTALFPHCRGKYSAINMPEMSWWVRYVAVQIWRCYKKVIKGYEIVLAKCYNIKDKGNVYN